MLREEAGFAEADTVARFLKDEKMQASARGGVVLVDEASLLGTRTCCSCSTRPRASVHASCWLGDRQQHRSVAAGEPLQAAGAASRAAGGRSHRHHAPVRRLPQGGRALSEGKTDEGFAELDKLGWVSEMPDGERYQVLAEAYLRQRRKRSGEGGHKSALVVSPTHAEAARITGTIRAALKEQGKLGEERTLAAWMPAQLTDAQKHDAANYDPGDMLQFHQNTPGQHNGSRLVVAGGEKLPLELRRPLRGLPPGAIEPGRRRSHPRHRQRQDQGRQAQTQ